MNARTSPLLLSSSPSAPSSPKVSLFTTALTIWRASVVVALLATLLNPWMLSRLPIRLRLPIGRSTSSASISSATGALASSGRPGLTKLTRSSEGAKGVHTTGKQKAQEVPSTYYGSATNSAAEVASSLRSMVSLTDRSLNGTSSVKSGEDETVPEAFGNFDRIVGPLKLDYANVKLAKWQSRETGLTVVWVDMEGPLVNGYFTVATEIFDDSGCPHTLEHLIFLGSEKYPYKGILDSLANRAFARGTNAWTDTSHTAYTITTAGEDGFLRLLPVYVDHVLYPTITSAGYVTEVHHVNGKGEDAGVVYSEMQGRENGSGDLMALRAQRSLYPEGSGYRSETGGLMEALRVLNVEKIRQYHSTYYAPHNLALLITGKVSPTKLLQVLQDTVEPSIIAHQQAHGPKGPSGWKRPFLETGSKGGGRVEKGQKEEVVEFPEKDESSGEVQISWVGPKTTDLMGDAALDLLTTYLSDSAVSPLSKEFIEIDDPFCTDITFYSTDGEVTVMSAYLSSVPTEHLRTISTQFRSAIARAADEGIDMNRMGMLIERGRLRVLNQMETDATDSFATGVISDFLYGDRTGKNLVEGMTEEMKRWETLGSWSSEQWAKELKRWLVDNPSLVVIGKPSAALADKLDADTKARIEATKAKYGEKGLEKLQRDLDAAQKENDVEVPKEILESFPVPSVDSIRWIEVETGRAQPGATSGPSNDLQQLLDSDKADVPVFVQYDHVESNFLTLTAHLSPANLPSELHGLLPVYLGAFFSLPVRRADGSELSFEEVVQELDRETIEYDIRIGSVLSQTIELSLKVEKTRYESTVRWLRDLLWGLVFDVDRLRVTAAKILQSLPSMKREGNYVADALYSEQLYDRKLAPSLGMNLLRQDEEIPEILARLKQEPKGVVAELEQLRKHLTDPSTMRISVAGNVKSLSRPKSDFVKNFQKLEPASLKPPLFGSEVLGAQGKQPSGKAVICSMSTIESSFATHVAAGPKGWLHPDLPALSVANSVLNAMESYLWRYIRGAGLAYGASIRMSPETGHVSLRIYRSPDSAKAFAEAGRVIKELVSGKIKLDELTVETAKSSMAYTTAQLESTVGEAAYLSFSNTALKGVPRHFQRELLAKAQQVSLDDCLGAIKKYLLPIFETSSFAVVAASVTKADAIAEALAGQGFDVERRELSASKDSDDESEEGSEEDESMSEAENDGR